MNPATAGTHLHCLMTLKCEYAMVMEIRWRRNDSGFRLSPSAPFAHGTRSSFLRVPMNARIAPPASIDLNPDAIVRNARTVIATEAAAIQVLECREIGRASCRERV